MNGDDLRQHISDLLAECRTASLATVDAEGRPHACNVQFAFDDELRLYFVSSPDSAHGSHIARGCDVALTVYAHEDADPTLLRGLQLRGRCEPLPKHLGGEGDVVPESSDVSPAWRVAHACYAARYPFIDQLPYSRAMETNLFYRVTPSWIRLIDNRRGFGFKRVLQL